MKGSKTATTKQNGLNASKLKDFEKRISELEQEIKALSLTIDEVEDEKLEVTNQLKKALADYQNLESSIDRRIDIRMAQTKKSVAQSLMTIMDDIHYGIKAKDNLDSSGISTEVQAWISGMAETANKMSNVLKELDIELMEVNPGDDMDSSKHEVVTVIPGDKDNKIVEMLQPGYMMGDMIIRPAKVVVSKIS